MTRHGRPKYETICRARLAASLISGNFSKRIITCGWDYHQNSGLSLAAAIKKYLNNFLKIPPSIILCEAKSRDTVGDALFTKIDFAIPNDWRKLCIVTSDYHVVRTKRIFEFVYGKKYRLEVMGSKALRNKRYKSKESRSLNAFNKTFANIPAGNDSAILNRLKNSHPLYNGSTHNMYSDQFNKINP